MSYDEMMGGQLANQGPMEAKQVGHPTMKQRLEWAVQHAEEKLHDAKRARDILNNNPELEELLNIMNKNHF